MNDLPIDQIPPNVQHLQHSELGQSISQDSTELKTSDFEFTVSPFDEIMTQIVPAACNSPTFGFQINTDEINGRTFIKRYPTKHICTQLFWHTLQKQTTTHQRILHNCYQWYSSICPRICNARIHQTPKCHKEW